MRGGLRRGPARVAASVIVLFLTVGAASGLAAAGLQPDQTSSAADTLRGLLAARPLPRDLGQLAVEYRGASPPRRVVNDAPPREAVGELHSFWIGRQNPPSHREVDAELRRVGRHAYWYVQTDKVVPEGALDEAARAFDSRIYPEVRRLIGSEAFPGIDNDPRVTIFVGDLPDVAGYVSSADGYPRSIHPYSNEREVVYVSSRPHRVGSTEFLATLAHEFTHLVHWNVTPNEDAWIKEGLAQLVAYLLFPETGLPSGGLAAAPDLQLTAWPDSGATSEPISAHYEAASWFLHYVQQRFGDGELARALASGSRGVAALDSVFRDEAPSSTFADVFADWAIANVIGTSAVLDGAVVGYRERAPSKPRSQVLSVGRTISESVGQYGVRYYEIVAPSSAMVKFDGSQTVPTIDTEGAPPEQPFWLAGLSDGSLATLTRRFDLRQTTRPSLDFSIWFDTEASYDFVHLAVSADDGRSWSLVETPGMVRSNPTGNGLGVGFTGKSGSGRRPEWVRERLDLTAFAGQVVDVRFIYLTDDAILREGVALSDVRLDDDGHDASVGAEDDWLAHGWARVGLTLPQLWSVRAIEYSGRRPRVVTVPVDEQGQGRWWADGRTVDRVIFVVAGLTPATLERGTFHLWMSTE